MPTASQRPLCFVIGPISKEGSDTRKHADLLLNAVVRHTLESAEFGYQVKRADEDGDPGMIGDRVVTDILHAELVVADLTDLNPNVFYELGIRHATGKPTIHIARTGTPLPFDNVGHRTIFVDLADWESIQSGRSRLSASAHAIENPEHLVSNPVTHAIGIDAMRASADPQDVIIAKLGERVASIEARLTSVGDLDTWSRKSPAEKQSIYVDTRGLYGDGRGKIITMSYNTYVTVGEFLDDVFYSLNSYDNNVEPFTYDDQWFLEGPGGKKLATTRKGFGIYDTRTLPEAGIRPETVLMVKPARPDWAENRRQDTRERI